MKKLIAILLCLSLALSLGVLSVLASEELTDDAPEAAAEPIAEEAPPTLDGDESDGGEPSDGGETGGPGKVTPTDAEETVTPTDAYDESGNLLTSGTIPGTQITWRYEDGVLTLEGAGAMPDFASDNGENHVPWFAWTDKIDAIIVGEGITRVGANMASLCLGLQEIDLPEGLTEIGNSAFNGCVGLTHVFLPSTLESIGSSAFADCAAFDAGLQYINFPDGLKSIGDRAFDGDPLAAVVLPASLESIGESAFQGTAIHELTIPGGVTLGAQAFGACRSLTSVTVEDGVTVLPEHCFDGCSSLTELELPNTIEAVGRYAVNGTALTALALPSDDEYQFAGWFDEDGNIYTPEDVMQTGGSLGTLYPSWLYAWVEGRFTDVSATAWYHDAVQYCFQAGLMNGMSETTFAPNDTATRAQVVTVLWRLAGEPEGSGSAFSDVTAGSWYAGAVAWAAEAGVTTGYPDRTFRPGSAVTRQEFLTFLYRFTQYWAEPNEDYEGDPVSGFADSASIGSWALPAERWSTACGLQTGVKNSDGTYSLNPTQSIKRSEMATFLMRYCVSLTLS